MDRFQSKLPSLQFGRPVDQNLRSFSTAQKAAVAEAVRKNVWPLLIAGRVKPVIHATFPLAAAGEAHRLMETSNHIGKIVLTMP